MTILTIWIQSSYKDENNNNIGAGSRGYETAVEAAKEGINVTLITYGPLGGTCLNEYSIPKKVFCHDSEEGKEYVEALNHNEDNTILGFDIIGEHASDLIHKMSILMNAGVIVNDAKDMIIHSVN